MKTKICNKCKKKLTLDNFYKIKNKYFDYLCKKCKKELAKNWKKK